MELLTLLKNMSCSLLSSPLVECSREQMYFKKRNVGVHFRYFSILSLPPLCRISIFQNLESFKNKFLNLEPFSSHFLKH